MEMEGKIEDAIGIVEVALKVLGWGNCKIKTQVAVLR